MKPWREIAVPHRDVRDGNFKQSEFAADLTAVRTGKAPPEYGDPVAFFERTYITEGMRILLAEVMRRLAGQGGDPVVQLQTAFGGGKTHTLLASYHLASRECELSDLAGVSEIADQADLVDVPRSKVAVLDGTAHSPGQAWKHGTQRINTLWGELAWQLGGPEGYELVREADQNGTSPGKDDLHALLSRFSPCLILVDELVAYIRQFPEDKVISGGTYDSNLSFVQVLTEAVKLVPTAVVLASLPESEAEAGGERGRDALHRLEKVFGRIQALWKPVQTEEAFEIVRRRLFESITDGAGREAVCRAFAEMYRAEGARLPTETQETRYRDRMLRAYPIHPEIFDRLYEDWATIDGFQRTRGVLKLMAQVIYRLWKDNNTDYLILPGSIPLYDASVRNELTYYLQAGWDPVIERDIDGDRAETTELENREARFGQTQAARRVARTLFLGSAPASFQNRSGARGLDRARVVLGCLQPGQPASVYMDALSRLIDQLHYLNASGDKEKDATRYWFDTRANLRREMEDRKRRFDTTAVRDRIAQAIKKVSGGIRAVDSVHIFTPHADVPDDSAVRLVVLGMEQWFARAEERVSREAVEEYLRNNGTRPRQHANRLLFLVADHGLINRLADFARVALAWEDIVNDIQHGQLNIDLIQKRQAEKEAEMAADVLPRVVRECYRWLVVPSQPEPREQKIVMEAFQLPSGGSLGAELARVCKENELIIEEWSALHLRNVLAEIYWSTERPSLRAEAFWEDTLRYLYLPRLRDRDVLARTIRIGAKTRDFFGIALSEVNGRYEGFQFGDADVQLNDTLILIEPHSAAAYQSEHEVPTTSGTEAVVDSGAGGAGDPVYITGTEEPTIGDDDVTLQPARPRQFIGSAQVPATMAKARLVDLADEIIALLAQDPNAEVAVLVEIHASFPNGVSDKVKRAVSENAAALKLKTATWEE